MASKKTPYGYILANGSIAVDAEEAEIIKRIFADRISGLSGMKIGTALYNERISTFSESTKKSADRVYAILNDKRYYGENGYPTIITEETFIAAKGSMNKKTFGKEQDTYTILRKKSFCTECGRNMVHFSDKSGVKRWRCTTKGCINSKPRISNKDFTQAVWDILNSVIKSPEMLDTGEPLTEYIQNDRITSLEAEIRELYNQVPIDSEKIRSRLLELAAAKYECCTYSRAPYVTKELVGIAREHEPMEELSKSLLTQLVESINVDKNTNISVTFKNGKSITA